VSSTAPAAGSGADEDIVVSSARAYVSALNKMVGWLSVASRNTETETSYKERRQASLESVDQQAAVAR
jgi:2-isopropylmalate synthase